MTTKRFVLMLLVMLGSVTGAWAVKHSGVTINRDFVYTNYASVYAVYPDSLAFNCVLQQDSEMKIEFIDAKLGKTITTYPHSIAGLLNCTDYADYKVLNPDAASVDYFVATLCYVDPNTANPKIVRFQGRCSGFYTKQELAESLEAINAAATYKLSASVLTTYKNNILNAAIADARGLYDSYVEQIKHLLHVVYNPNASGIGSAKTDDIIISGSIKGSQFTRTGYTFTEWNTQSDGSGTTYNPGDVITVSDNGELVLYAQWTPNQYTVTLDMQGGGEGTTSVTATYNAAMPEITIPTREDYAFLGYFSQPNGRGTKYYNADGTSAQAWNITSNTTLYAQWEVVRAWFIDADGSSKSVTDFTTITDKSETTTLSSGWYIVYEADVRTKTLVCEGAVHLILMDGAKLTATGDYFDAGIRVSAEGASLTIYGQKDQNGQLIATGDCYGAGIGGANNCSGHDITINGGVITANGGFWGAGIGGGSYGTGHDITINGGVITAVGGDASAIGAGDRGSSSNIFINSSLILWADGSNPPTTIITHLPDEDVSSSLNGRTYAIVRNPAKGVTITFEKQSGTGGTNQITVDEGSVMPDISVPERDGYAFVGYFSGPDGTGTKYYKCDGTSDQLWNQGENVTLYAYWTSPVPYIDADGTTKYAGIDKEITNETTTLRSGWYLVNDPDVQTRTLVCEGDVHLILADGAKLKATGDNRDAGIRVSAEGASLTIYGQQNQMGQLIAKGGRHSAGIGGGVYSLGHDITINGGMITATGLDDASAIGGGEGGSSSNIFVNSSLVLYADSNNPPTTIIGHTTDTDVSGSISAKQYAIVRKPVKGITVTFDKQDGIGGDDQTTANESEEMPQINVPKRDGYAFCGYYAGKNGTGFKYYNPDGTSAHLWNLTENTTLYAHWSEPVPYIGTDGETKYTGIDSEIINTTSTLNSGWYIVRGKNITTGTIVCNGEVNLILANGAKLTATGGFEDAGIRVSEEGASLTIYGQKDQNGQLIAIGGFYGAGIGGGHEGNAHNITINGGMITATGGYRASAIGGGYEGSSSNIFVNSSLVLYADGNNPPATITRHATDTDVSSSLLGKQYAIVRKPVKGITVTFDKQDGTGGDDQTTVDEGSDMSQIAVPTRNGYYFQGYYAGENGTGIKYYNPDGTSAHLWDLTENTTLYANWKEAVSYIDADGTEKKVGVFEEITNSTTTLAGGWYIVRGSDVQTHTLVCEGNVNLILFDGKKLTATGDYKDAGIRVSAEGASLTIYGQKDQNGQLIATGGFRGAGIGGADEGSGHDITINGGVITANGGYGGAGIGGGNNGTGHDITINGGVITAVGGDASAIGAGDGGSSSNIFVNKALILKADGNIQPETEIEHESTDDLTSALSGKQYATLTLPSVNVNKVPEQDVNYGTFYHKYADYTVPNEDATIYTASVEDVQGETCLVLHKVEGNVIPANTAVILRTDESSVIDLKPCADASGNSVPANNMSGANLPIDAPDNCYIMSYGQNGFGFYKYAVGKTLSAHKAYLTYQHPAGAQARALRMVFEDDEVNGIENINDNPLTDSGQAQNIYSISGVRLNKLQKGINIVNGKKIIIK